MFAALENLIESGGIKRGLRNNSREYQNLS
jgi:hypothetical protein